MGRRQVAVCAALATLATYAHSTQANTPVLLVSPPKELRAATTMALTPWDLHVEVIDEIVPSETMPGARDRAKLLAEQHQARAIVWLTTNKDGAALWVYDAQDDRVIVRRLSVTLPLDEATAASVALSIKTLLMHSQAAPPEQRFGAEESSNPAFTPTSQTSSPPSVWSLEVQGLARHSLADDGSTEIRLGLGLSRRLRALDLAAGLILGPGRSVDSPGLQGHYSDFTLGVELRYPTTITDWTLTPSLLASAHWTEIEGTLGGTDARVSATRLNPSLGAGLLVMRRVGILRVGLRAQSSYFLRSQRYLVSGEPVLDLPSADFEFGAHIALPFL